MYKKIINMLGNIEENIIKRTSDNAFIPFDEANTDYQEYLEWVAEGNTPEEAE
jgi:23S rRNA maturation mini-RNase III